MQTMTHPTAQPGGGTGAATPVAEPATHVTRTAIPGAGTLEFERLATNGALVAVRGGGRTYLTADPATSTADWHGVCSMRDETEDRLLRRHVINAHGAWDEWYRWDGGRLVEIDGVLIRRDARGRVIACVPGGADPAPADHRWLYTHTDTGLVRVDGPFGTRAVHLEPEGRPRSVVEDGVAYRIEHDAAGRRRAAGRPLDDHIDEAGRSWAVRGSGGRIAHVYIWDGARCLARIDGEVGAPLAEVYSLDPSGTPVRVVRADGAARVPRDAYGEGLLRYRGVPGLYGGRVHAGLVHLSVRRLDPRTGVFCEPDPFDGADDDPRRAPVGRSSRRNAYEGPLPVEPEPRSAYELCRGDPVGRADPTGGISAGLVISDLTWSLQNNLLTFFGIDWTINLFGSLITQPFGLDVDFFSSRGLTASDRHGAFGVRRDGVIAAGKRAFATQHIIWAPESEFTELEHGEVIDCGTVELTHYGSILSIAPAGHRRSLLQSMDLSMVSGWTTTGSLDSWTRFGGRGVPVAPGALTPHFPSGGIHLDTPRDDVIGDTSCVVDELVPGAVGVGDLEDRSFLTSAAPTSLAAGDRVVVGDGTNLALSTVIAVLPAGTGQRIQLADDLGSMGNSGLSVAEVAAAPASTETHPAGPVVNSIDVHGTTATYVTNDLLRLTSGADVTVARVERLEVRLGLDRPLPAGFGGPITVTRGTPGVAQTVTMAGTDLDFGSGSRPQEGSVGLVTGGGTSVAVRIESHTGTNAATLDVALPAAVTGAATIEFRPVAAGTVLGRRDDPAETDPRLTYVPNVAGAAPDGTTGTLVVRCDAGGTAHARIVPAAPLHDVALLDRAIAGAGPYTTERFATTGTAVGGVSRSDVMAIVGPDPAVFGAAPAVFLTRVGGDPPSPVSTLASGDIRSGEMQIADVTSAGTGIEPGRPVLVGTRPAAVRSLRVTPTFDRAIDFGTGELRLVGLEGTGHRYLAEATGAAEVLAEPIVDVGGTNVAVPFPRFEVGDLVRVADRGGANPTWHRLASVSGARLGLAGGPPLTAGNLHVVQAVATSDPGNGGAFLGIAGSRAGTGATSTATFSVWATNSVAVGAPVGIVDGTVTHPAVVGSGPIPGVVAFSESFDLTGVDVASLDRRGDRFVPTLARDGAALLLEGTAAGLTTGTGESIVAVAYVSDGRSVTGTMGPGAFTVPEGEGTEVTRVQALIDHELTHTLQYSKFGPLWFCLFPMFALDLPGILTTDAELPEFSSFLDATAAVGTGSRWTLTIDAAAGVSIGVGDELQVVQGSRHLRVTVRSITGADHSVTVNGGGSLPTGQVSVRKLQNSGADAFNIAYSIMDLLTQGGLLNVTAGTVWGGIFWLLGKGFYGLGRAIGGTGELYPATVQAGGGALTISNASDVERFRVDGRIVIRRGNDTVIRSMNRSEAVVTLAENVEFTGDVQIAMYDTHNPGDAFDWYDYFPATVDASNHFSITLASAGTSTLSLSPEDRVQVKYRTSEFKTDVLAVVGDTVELSERVPVTGGELSLRIAKVGSSDPLGNWDSAVMVNAGMGWMKWLFDPYGQIEYAAAPDEEWARWLLRVMRWVLGSQSFSLLPFGYAWWFRLFREADSHTMFMEQQASQESGDLYSPLGRLYGQVTDDGWATKRMVVGDVARYRYWPLDRHRRSVARGVLDSPSSPGVVPGNYDSQLRTMPNRDLAGGGTAAPNLAVEVGSTAAPGTFVAEPFIVRAADPRAIPSADVLGFETSVLGSVPVGARTEKTFSSYVAFTRPGTHRVTTVNGIGGAGEAVDAFDVGQFDVFHGGQTLFYDVTVADVSTTVGGATVDASNPGTSDRVVIVPFQQAPVVVGPNTARVYRVTVPDPAGATLRADGTTLVGRGSSGGTTVPVEVSRLYEVGADGSYGPGGLSFAGMHLSRPLHLPVRRFDVEVVDTLPIRSTADPAAAAIASLARGTRAFLLVPAPIVRPPSVVSIGGAAPAAGDPDPVSRADAPDAAAFLGTAGAAFAIEFPPGAATGAVVLSVRVGVGGDTADLTCTFQLT